MSNSGCFVKINDHRYDGAEMWINLSFVLSITPKIHGVTPVSVIIFSNGTDSIMANQTPEQILGIGGI